MLGTATRRPASPALPRASFRPTVNPDLVYSKAVRLVDGTPASGGNRYEDAQIALWEFKTGNGLIAYDTSGVDPAIDLTFSGDVSWYGGWGITIGNNEAQGPGKARGSTTASKKLYDILQAAGEFSIEAWVVPANVTQEMAQIVSYSSSAGQKLRAAANAVQLRLPAADRRAGLERRTVLRAERRTGAFDARHG